MARAYVKPTSRSGATFPRFFERLLGQLAAMSPRPSPSFPLDGTSGGNVERQRLLERHRIPGSWTRTLLSVSWHLTSLLFLFFHRFSLLL
jgi:hypothetical protein